MKVAFDISPLFSGHRNRGIGNYTHNLYQEFKENKFENVSFTFFKDSKNPPNSDVIHHPYFDLFFKTLDTKTSTPKVVTIHDVIPLIFPARFPSGIKGKINLFLQKRSLKNTAAIICDSKASKRDIVKNLSVPEQKVKVVYLAPGKNFKRITDQNKLGQISKKFKLPKEFVLYVGDVNWNKNLENLILSLTYTKVNLVMVGSALKNNSLPQVESLDRLIVKHSLEKRVFKTGYVEEEYLISLYNLAQATLQPSYYEGFGLPILESAAIGTPIICSKNSSQEEVAPNEVFFCNPEDPKDIAKNIDLVLALKTEEKEIISENLIKHAANYSWGKTAKKTIEVYEEVIK